MRNTRTALVYSLPLLSIVLSLIVYSNSFSCGWYFDDFRCIVNYDYTNASFTSLYAFYPLRFVGFCTFWANHTLCGYNIWGWHLVNLLIHCVNIVLVFFLSLQLFKASSKRISNPCINDYELITALVISALFAVHPIQTQAVTYIVQRMELLGTSFVLLTVLGLINAGVSRTFSNRITWGIIAVVSFVLGFFTKEFIVVAPLIAGLYYVLFVIRSRKHQIAAVGITALCGVIAAAGILYWCHALRFNPLTLSFGPFARLWDDALPPDQYYPTQVRVLLMYIRLCLVPFGQHVEYYIAPSSSFLDIRVLFAAAVQLLLIAAGILTLKRRPVILFGIAWFYLFLAPSSTLLPNGMYEHRLYGPMLGLLFALCIPLSLEIVEQPARIRNTLGRIALSLTAFLIVCFCFLTCCRNQVWHSGMSLWGDAVGKSPQSWRANVNFGKQLMDNERYEEALPYLEKSFVLNSNIVEVAYNLGVCKFNTGDQQGAINLFKYALSLNPRLPEMKNMLNDTIVLIYTVNADDSLKRKQYPRALQLYTRVLEYEQSNTNALQGQALCIQAIGDTNTINNGTVNQPEQLDQ